MSIRATGFQSRKWRRMLGASTALAGLVSGAALAGPQDGQVTSGQAVIQQAGNGRTNIIQSTDRAVIDWRSFSIGAGEHVDFQQPSAGSVTLNRVTGNTTSLIDGRLTANGNIFLVNPNGVFFGRGASVDVGGLVATTTDLSNANFMAGRFILDRPSPVAGASVVNEGAISVREGGLAALVAPTVRNSGIIAARLGHVALAGTETATVDLYGDGLIAFDTGVATAVTQDGAIRADGGTVLLTTAQAKGVVDSAINMGGTVTAQTVEKKGGKIILKGAGTVAVSGTLDASGKDAGQTGGEVKVLGDAVALQSTARIDVSGDQGGGTALVGGNVQGTGEEQRATTTLVAGGAFIGADAITAGRGGTVVVWADDATRFDGTISARGGAQGGDGGFVETSGKKTLAITTGKVDAAAPKGRGGQWLLDPRNVVIADTTGGDDTAGGSFDAGTPNTFTPNNNDAVVDASTIAAALNGGTDVTITTGTTGGQAGNITTTAGVTWTTSNTLTLNAAGDITLSQDFVGTSGALALNAAGAISQTGGAVKVATLTAGAGGAVSLAQNNEIGTLGTFSAGGNFTLKDTTGGLTLTGVTSGTAGTVSIETAGGDIAIQGDLTATAIALTTDGAISQTGGIVTTTTLTLSTGGDATLSRDNAIANLGASTVGGALSVNDADGGLTINGTVSATGAVSITTSGALAVQSNLSGDGVSLAGSGISVSDSVSIDGGSGTVTLSAGTGTLTLGASTLVLGTGTIALSADSIAIDATAQIGGTAAGADSASLVRITPASSGRTIGIAGGTGDLALSTGELATIRAGDVEIGSSTAGAISLGAWTPASTVASGTLTLISGAGIDFGGAVTLTGNLVLDPGGAITQTAALTVGGTTVIRNADGFDVTLDNSGNDFQGAVTLSGDTVSIRDANALTVGGTAGDLTIVSGALAFAVLNAASIDATAAGAITQTGDVSVTGTATLRAGANAITLDRSGNDFQGAVALSNSGANDVTLVTGGALSLGTSTVSSGTLSLTAGGDITQAGALVQAASAGTLSLTLTASGSDIVLDNAGNDISGTVALAGTAANLVDFSLRNTNAGATLPAFTGATNLRNLTIRFDNAGISFGAISASGALSATAGGAITQTGTLTVTGTSAFSAGSNAITLDDASNDFQGAVSLAAGAASLTDSNALTVGGGAGALTVHSGALAFTALAAASLDLTVTGAITQSGDLSIVGATSIAAGSNTVTLNRSGNTFGGSVSVAGGSVAISDSGALQIGGTTGALTLVAAGIAFDALSASSVNATSSAAVTQNGAISISGTATLSAGSADVTLDTGTNAFGTVAVGSAGAVSIADTNGINLGTISATSLQIAAGGTISQTSGAITVTGATVFQTSAGNIVANRSGNDFGGTVTASATGSVSLRDANALTLGNISATALTVQTTNGALTQAGGSSVTATGASSLTTGSGVITLGNSGNDFTGNVALSTTGTVSLTDQNALSLSSTGALALGDISATSLAVSAGGALSQASGTALAVTGDASFAASSGAITLDASANSIGGVLALSGTGAVSVTNTGAMALGTVSAGSLTLVAGGTITHSSGTVTVSGTTTLDAGSNDITLTAAGNDFGGAVSADGGAVSLTDSGALTLGDIGATSLAATAGGALTQAASTSLQITGATAAAGASVDLGNAGNSFGGTVSATASGAVSLAADAGLTLGAVSGSTLAATAGTSLQLTDAVSTSGAVSLSGTSFAQAGGTIAAGSGAISITADTMTLGSAGSIATTGAVTLQTADTARGITLGGTAGGTLSLTDTALDALSGASGLVIGRTDGTGTITVAGALDLTGNAANLTLRGTGAVLLGASITVTGDLTIPQAITLTGGTSASLTAGGDIALAAGVEGTDDAAESLSLAAGGTVTLGAVGQSVRLAAFSASGSTITLASVTTRDGQTYTGNVVLDGDVDLRTTDAAISISGSLNGTAGGEALTVDTGTGGFSAGAVGASQTLGAVDIAAGNITLASIAATGGISLDAGTGGVFVGAVSHGGGDVTVIANSVALSGNWSGSGNRTLRPSSIGRAINLGGTASASFALNATELAFLGAGSPALITIGRADGTGAVTITPFTFNDNLTIQGGATTLQSGTLSWTGARTLTIAANGDLTIQSAITGTAGTLSLAATGSVNQLIGSFLVGVFPSISFVFTPDGPITVAALQVSAGSNIGLVGAFSGAGNSVSGRTDLSAGGSITYLAAGAVTLGNVAASSLSLSGADSIAQASGTSIQVGGTASLGAAGAITLTRAANDFGGAVSISSGGAVSIVDANDLQLANVAAGSLAVTLGGDLTETAGATISVSGNTAITSSGGAIALTSTANDFGGTVSISGGGDTSLRDANDIALGTVGADSLSVIAGGALTQADATALTIANTASLQAAGIDLSNATNDFQGAVNVNTAGAVSLRDANSLTIGGSGGAIALRSGALTLQALNAGSLAITAAGDVGQTGDLSVTGTTDVAAGSNAVVLDRGGNSFGDAVSIVAGTASVAAGSDLVLGPIQATSLTVDAAGGVSQAGALVIAGTTSISAGAGGVTLADTGNDFGGAISVSTTGAVSLTDAGALTLGNITSGDLTILAGGAITQAASTALAVGGDADLTGPGAIALTASANSFAGTLAASAGGAVQVTAAGDLTLAGFSVSGDVSLQAGGTLAQTTGTILDVAGLTLRAGAGGIALAEANTINGTISIATPGAAAVRSSFSAELGDVDAASLALTAGGPVTQAGGTSLAVTGLLSVTLGTQADITLTAAANTIGELATANAANLAVTVAGDLLLRSGAVTGTLSVTASGAVSQSGPLSVGGMASVGGTAITLDDAGNRFAGGIALSGSSASIRDSAGLTVNGATVTGGLTLAAGGGIGQTAAITAGGTASLTTAAGDIILTDSGNDFGGTVAATAGGTVNLRDANALFLGDIQASALAARSGTALTQAGGTTLQIAGDVSLTAGSAGIALGNANTVTGALSLSTTGSAMVNVAGTLTFGQSTVGSLTATAASAIAQATGTTLSASGAAAFAAGSGGIALAETGNAFGDTVALNSAGAVLLRAAGNLALATSSAGSLDLGTGGAVTQATGATLAVAGATSISAGSVALDAAGNNFGDIVSVTSPGTVAIRDADDLIAGNITAAALTLDAAGGLTQVSGSAMTVGGATSLTAGSAGIALGQANALTGSVSIATAGSAFLRNDAALSIAQANASDLTIQAAGDVTQSGNLLVLGTVNVSAAGSDVVLDRITNAVGTFAVVAANASLASALNLVLDTSTVTGNLSIRSVSNVAQSGSMTVGGDLFASAPGVQLMNPANTVGGSVTLSGASIQMRATGTIDVASATATVAGFGLKADQITQSGAVNVAGILALDAGTGSVVFDNADNQFWSLFLTAGSALVANADTLRFGPTMVTGDLTAIAGRGIYQDSTIQIGGTATMSAGTGQDIVLSLTGNSFGTFVGSARDIQLATAGNLNLGAVTASRALTLTSGGAIAQTDAIQAATLTGSSAGDTILDNPANVIGRLDAFTAGGRLVVASAAGTFTIADTAQGTGGVSLLGTATGGTLTILSSAQILAGASDIVLQGDDIALAATVGGSGRVRLQPFTASRNIILGASDAGQLSLSQAEITLLHDGHAGIDIGRNDGSGRIDLRDVTFIDPVSFNAPAPGGSVKINGSLVGLDNASFNFNGSGATTTLNGSITTAGQAIEFNDAVLLASTLPLSTQPGRQQLPTAVIDTTGNGTAPGGADVTFRLGLNSTTAMVEGIDIYAGTLGAVTFEGSIGGDTAVGRLRVFSGASFMADVPFVNTRILDVDVGAGSVLARNVTAAEELLIRGVGGTADLTLSSVRGNTGDLAAFFVRRPDGVSATYLINGCVMATTCGMDLVFLGASLPPYRDDPDVGSRSPDGALASPVLRSPRLVSASVQSPSDEFSIQYSSPADRELW